MAHTLHCGQRRYTMPSLVIPTSTDFVPSVGLLNFVAMNIHGILPPSGLVIAVAPDDKGIQARLRFTTDHGVGIVAASPVPTLYLSDSVIQKVEYAWVNIGDFAEWWVIQDVSYVAEVRDAYGK